VTVPMGTMADIGMPVGLTFAGKAYDDAALLALAGDYERATQRRTAPPRTPALADDVFAGEGRAAPSHAGDALLGLRLSAETTRTGDADEIAIVLRIEGSDPAAVKVHVNGDPVILQASGNSRTGKVMVPASTHQGFHSVWRGSYGSIVTAIVTLQDGRSAGAYVVTGGIE